MHDRVRVGQVQPLLAAEGGRFVPAWFDLEEEAQLAGLASEELLDWRQERIRPLVESFRTWTDAVLPTLIPDDRLAKVIAYNLAAAELTPAAYAALYRSHPRV